MAGSILNHEVPDCFSRDLLPCVSRVPGLSRLRAGGGVQQKWALVQQGKLGDAILKFKEALRLDENYFPALLNLAYAYDRTARTEDAMAAWNVINAQPGTSFAHNNLGVLYDKNGLHDAAIAELETALKIEPGNALARKNLEVERKNKSNSEKRLSEILHAEKDALVNPIDPRASYNVARLYALSSNKEMALQWLSKALKLGYNDSYIRVDPAFNSLREEREFELLFVTK